MKAEVEFYQDKSSEWRWRLMLDSKIVADCGEGYTDRADCERDLVNMVQALRGTVSTVETTDGGGKVYGYLAALVAKVRQ